MKEDHRVQVGVQRRQRMRAHLLNSVLIVCSGADKSSAVIDDIIRHAGVSRGTFYKYFDSLDRAIEEQARELADGMAEGGIKEVYESVSDPLIRAATGFQLYLLRALIEPEWGGFLCHVGLLNSDGKLAQKIIDDIQACAAVADFALPSTQLAIDMLIGTKIEAIRRIISGSVGPDYVCGMTSLVLKALGVSPAKADYVSKFALDRICIEAPKHLEWWRPLGKRS